MCGHKSGGLRSPGPSMIELSNTVPGGRQHPRIVGLSLQTGDMALIFPQRVGPPIHPLFPSSLVRHDGSIRGLLDDVPMGIREPLFWGVYLHIMVSPLDMTNLVAE